jgi:hypothetical protein
MDETKLTFNCLPNDAILSCLYNLGNTSRASYASQSRLGREYERTTYSFRLRNDQLLRVHCPVDHFGTWVWVESEEARMVRTS